MKLARFKFNPDSISAKYKVLDGEVSTVETALVHFPDGDALMACRHKWLSNKEHNQGIFPILESYLEYLTEDQR